MDEQHFYQMLENSDRTVIALEGSRIVGFGRALCDDVSVGYLTWIFVSDDKRGQGIGSKMARILMGNDPNIKWVLTSELKNMKFWEKLGFRAGEDLMVKPRITDMSYHKDISSLTTKNRFKNYIRYLVMKPKNLILRKLSR